MSLWTQRAELGRIEPCLRFIGLTIWFFVGFSRWDAAMPSPRWVWPWLGFGVAFLVSSLHRKLPLWVRRLALGAQTLCVLRLPHLGLAGFEGLLLSVVAAQAPTLLSLRWAVVWTVAQASPLVATVWTLKSALEIGEILGAYSTFCAFALLLYWLELSEREARQSLARANIEILGAHSLVVEGARQAERLRISRELHDSLGHQLTALRLQLELAGCLGDGATAQKALAQARGLLQEALNDLRKVVHTIQAAEWIDLPGAVRALAAGLPGTSIQVEASDGFAVSGQVGSVLFRCIQEAVTNSLKHSGGNTIWISLVYDASTAHRVSCVLLRREASMHASSAFGGGLSFVLLAANPFGGLLVAIPFAIMKLHYPAWVATLVGTPLAYVQVAVVDVAWSVLGRWPAWDPFLLARRSKRIERVVASGGSFWVTFFATPFVGPWLVMAFMR
jgi:signal transduction histidine kinase